MNVEYTKRTFRNLPPKKSILLRGPHGIGKSQFIRQMACELSTMRKTQYQVVDIRLSQREPADIIGMPKSVAVAKVTIDGYDNGQPVQIENTIEDSMVHDLPVWFPRDPESYGILFLDELDRAPRESQQAGFELVLDYMLNLHQLPKGWIVVSAVNANVKVYQVLSMDPALMDRFLVIDFKPTVPEWLEHAEEIGVHDSILKYVHTHDDDLHCPEDPEPGRVYPSPRSWVNLSDFIKNAQTQGDDLLMDLDYLTLLSAGYVGNTCGVSFVEYIKNEYKVFTPEEILKFSKETQDAFKNMDVPEVAHYRDILIRAIKKGEVKMTAKQKDNLFKLFKIIPKESAAGWWRTWLEEDRDSALKWFNDEPEIGKYIMSLIKKSQALGGS